MMVKVFCKKVHPSYRKNNYYEIFIEYNDSYWIYNDDKTDVYKFFKKQNKHEQHIVFDDYFCDIKKSRQEKLQKIYDKID